MNFNISKTDYEYTKRQNIMRCFNMFTMNNFGFQCEKPHYIKKRMERKGAVSWDIRIN